MKTTTQPYNFSVVENFPNARQVRGWEGGCAYLAERDSVPYIIIDEGTLADFVSEDDRDLLDQLVKVMVFENEAEREHYIRTQWPGDET